MHIPGFHSVGSLQMEVSRLPWSTVSAGHERLKGESLKGRLKGE